MHTIAYETIQCKLSVLGRLSSLWLYIFEVIVSIVWLSIPDGHRPASGDPGVPHMCGHPRAGEVHGRRHAGTAPSAPSSRGLTLGLLVC